MFRCQMEMDSFSERRELQLDVEATALSQEKDDASKQRLKQVKEELSKIREELKPLKLKHRAGALLKIIEKKFIGLCFYDCRKGTCR